MQPQRRRPARSPPPRIRKYTTYPDQPPFVSPSPVPGQPVYLTNGRPPLPHEQAFSDPLHALCIILLLALLAVALVGSGGIIDAVSTFGESPSAPPSYTPIQQRGMLSWAWLIAKKAVWD